MKAYCRECNCRRIGDKAAERLGIVNCKCDPTKVGFYLGGIRHTYHAVTNVGEMDTGIWFDNNIVMDIIDSNGNISFHAVMEGFDIVRIKKED